MMNQPRRKKSSYAPANKKKTIDVPLTNQKRHTFSLENRK